MPVDVAGAFEDRLTVVFRPGTPRSRVDEINAAIGARVLLAPLGTGWYRVKPPAGFDVRAVVEHYEAQAEVITVLPAVNFADHAGFSPNDDRNPFAHADVSVHEAWQRLLDEHRGIGSHDVRVAIIDGMGVDLVHPDLYRNIAINQRELPPQVLDVADGGIRGVVDPVDIALFDCDPPGGGDGLITFRDFECSSRPCFAPRDADGGIPGVVDALDLLQPYAPCNDAGVLGGGWADGVDGDPMPFPDGGPLPDGPVSCASGLSRFCDDLCGWNLANDGNNANADRLDADELRRAFGDAGPPEPGNVSRASHGTGVAGVVGAEGNNDAGVAGAAWRVSIVPVRMSGGIARGLDARVDFGTPDVNLAAALQYVEANGFEIANLSVGHTFVRRGADVACGDKETQTTPGVDDVLFLPGVPRAVEAYRSLVPEGGPTLYTVSAGNSGWNLSDFDVLHVPAEPLRQAAADRVIVVGGTMLGGGTTHPQSSYAGSSAVEIYAPFEAWTLLMPGVVQDDGSTMPGGLYPVSRTGTSFAAPLVAGVAALAMSADPALLGDAGETKRRVVGNARPVVDAFCPASDLQGMPLLDADRTIAESLP